MAEDELVHFLNKRKDRTLAILLRQKETMLDPYLPKEEAAKYRKVILDAVNQFADVAADLLRSRSTENELVNQLWLDRLEEIHSAVMNGNGSGS